MEFLFQKTKFPKSPGGNCYEWKEAEVIFDVKQSGLHVIKITASAKSEKQNNSTDDDDLRISLDGFSFGKYEKNSWKGFGSSSSWNGSTLMGGTKIIYFFAELGMGSHRIQFFADETPQIKSAEVSTINDGFLALTDLRPFEKIETSGEGVPWVSLVFLGTHPKSVLLDVNVKSAKEKNSTDGDNLKIVVNGNVLQNERASASNKYKNFYFSGDVRSAGTLSIHNEDLSKPLAFENSVELLYDEDPQINSLEIDFFDTEKFLDELKEVDLRSYVLKNAHVAIFFFQITNSPYSAKFLEHSLEEYPSSLVFQSNHPIVKKIKADSIYEKILEKLREKITDGIMEGEILPSDMGGAMSLESADLKTAIHGIKKIEYAASSEKNGEFKVKMVFFDVYDFEKQDVPFFLFHGYEYAKNTIINAIDMGEGLHIIHNFEIQINIIDKLKLI